MMGRARGPSTGGPRHALLGHGPRPLLGRPVGPRPLMRPAGTVDHGNFVQQVHSHFIVSKCIILIPMAIIKRWEPGIPPSYYKCDPRLLLLENRRKREPKVTPSCSIPHLLVGFTQQLGILVTILHTIYCHVS